jgi:hypothetical protein
VSDHILPLACLHSPVFLLNSRMRHFSAASLSSRHPFSRSYGVILPSSLAAVLSSTLEYSSRLPVSVCGTGGNTIGDEGFLGSMITQTSPCGSYSGFMIDAVDLPAAPHYALEPGNPTPGSDVTSASLLHFITLYRRYRNINLLSIDYAIRPRLRPD